MTPTEIAAIEARVAAATPGPWTIKPFNSLDKEIVILEPAVKVDNDDVDPDEAAANAALIANAPTDLARLLADRRELVARAVAASFDLEKTRHILAGGEELPHYWTTDQVAEHIRARVHAAEARATAAEAALADAVARERERCAKVAEEGGQYRREGATEYEWKWGWTRPSAAIAAAIREPKP